MPSNGAPALRGDSATWLALALALALALTLSLTLTRCKRLAGRQCPAVRFERVTLVTCGAVADVTRQVYERVLADWRPKVTYSLRLTELWLIHCGLLTATFLLTFLLTHLPTYSLPFLLTYLLTHLLTYVLTHLPTYSLTYLLTVQGERGRALCAHQRCRSRCARKRDRRRRRLVPRQTLV